MKIALFTDTFLPEINGVTNTLKQMIRFYEKNEIEYKIFAPKYEESVEGEHIVQFMSLKFFLYPESRVTLPNIFRISQTLSEFQPDLIHLMTEFNMGMTGLKFGKKLRIPVVSTYTTNFAQYLKYYRLDFLEDKVHEYMKWFHQQAGITLCPSLKTQAELYKNGIDQTDIFSRGIDIELYHPQRKNNQWIKTHRLENKLIFLYVGRISMEKDLDILCQSYCLLYEKYKEKVAFVLTGEGPYQDYCRDHLPKGTIFTGFKKGLDLAEIYASADIFVCPSSTETFGNVVQEAMASGLAVIGADAGGVGENIRHLETGLHFKAGDVQDLYCRMEHLLQNEGLRQKLGETARAYTTTRSWDSIMESLCGIYHKVLQVENKQIRTA